MAKIQNQISEIAEPVQEIERAFNRIDFLVDLKKEALLCQLDIKCAEELLKLKEICKQKQQFVEKELSELKKPEFMPCNIELKETYE